MRLGSVFNWTPGTEAARHVDIHKDIYSVMQKSLDTRGNMLNIECQVTFAANFINTYTTDTQTDRQTKTQTKTQTDRQTDRNTDRQKHRHTDRQTDRQMNRQQRVQRYVGNLYTTKLFPEWWLRKVLALCVLWTLCLYSAPIFACKTGSQYLDKTKSMLLVPARNTLQNYTFRVTECHNNQHYKNINHPEIPCQLPTYWCQEIHPWISSDWLCEGSEETGDSKDPFPLILNT
jgi:hypothetical protein